MGLCEPDLPLMRYPVLSARCAAPARRVIGALDKISRFHRALGTRKPPLAEVLSCLEAQMPAVNDGPQRRQKNGQIGKALGEISTWWFETGNVRLI